jgi:hypothetical protein
VNSTIHFNVTYRIDIRKVSIREKGIINAILFLNLKEEVSIGCKMHMRGITFINRDKLKEKSVSCSKKVNQEFDIKKESGFNSGLYKNFNSLNKNRFVNLKRIVKKYFNYKVVRIVYFFVKN